MGGSFLKTKVPSAPGFIPIRSGRLQRKCDCGQHGCGAGAKFAACQGRRAAEAAPAQAMGARFAHDFSGVRVYSGQSPCSPDWYGDSKPEMDETTGKVTGKVKVTYNDAAIKSPCVKDCIQKHEAVHVKQLTPVVQEIHKCEVAAKGDPKKQEKCDLLFFEKITKAPLNAMECEAYQVSKACLARKLADKTCSKEPHRKAVEQHLKQEECELADRKCSGSRSSKAKAEISPEQETMPTALAQREQDSEPADAGEPA